MTEENKNTDQNIVDGDIGDKVIEGEEIFVVEEVGEKPAKSDKDDETKAEDLKETKKSADELSDDETKVEITDSMQVKILETKIQSLGRDLADAQLTPDQIRKNVPIEDLQADIGRQRTILSNIDKELNPDEWAEQNRIVTTLDGDITDKERDSKLEERFNSQDNEDFLKREKKLLADKGLDFSDVQFDAIAGASKPYLENGKYTSNSIQKALTDILGSDVVSKMYQTGSEQKIRDDLKSAAPKVTKSVRVTRDGVSVKLVPFIPRLLAMTDQFELERELDELSSKELAIYERALKKQNK